MVNWGDAANITISDIMVSRETVEYMRKAAASNIWSILDKHSKPAMRAQLIRRDKHGKIIHGSYERISAPEVAPLPVEKSDLHTLIAFNRNEAVINEVIEIILDIMAELELSPAELLDKVILFKGDYMTVRNILYDFPGSRAMDFGPRPYTNGEFIRRAAFRRQEDEPIHQLRFVEPVIGLFHLQMCILGTIYKAHWGSEEGREPASISRFVKLLGKPGILSPKVTDFRSYAQLFDQILDSYIIAIAAEKVKAVSEHDFHQRLGDTNWPRLIEAIVEDIFPADHGIARVHRMRYGSDGVEVPLVERDLPYEKFLLLCQQGLVYRDYSAAVSAGDTGRLNIFFQFGRRNYMAPLIPTIRAS